MALSNNYRKLFVDSRWRSSGDHNDFTIELPNDVDTTRTSSVYLASCSFSNTFETVLPGVNDRLYVVSEDSTDRVPVASAGNLFLYALYRKERYVRLVTSANQKLYVMLQNVGVGNPYVLYTCTVAPAYYTVEALAAAVQTALRQNLPESPTVAWQEASKTYAFRYNPDSSTAQWWIPNASDLDAAVARFNPVLWTGTTLTPGDHSDTVNFVLNMPRLPAAPALPFGHSGSTQAVSFDQPTQALITRLDGWGVGQSFASAAAFLQTVFRAAFDANASVTSSNRSFTFDTGNDLWSLRIPSDAELRDASWKAANWPDSTPYDVANPASYNASLRINTPTAFVRSGTSPSLPATVYAQVLTLQSQQYATGTALANALQATLVNYVASGTTVAFDTSLGTLTLTAPTGWRLQFPTERELRDLNWRASNWDSVQNAASYSLQDPKSFNAQLFFPSPSALRGSTLTGNIDMTPYREVYLASSLSNYRTLQSGTGAKDILARIPIDVDYGQVVSYRHLGPSDALAASDEHFRVLRFRFVDWAGRLVPIDQPVVIELVFLDSDPYAM
jgi:hypothetical protein